MNQSFATICKTGPVSTSQNINKVGPGWQIFNKINREFQKKTLHEPTEDEVLENEWNMSFELEEVLYDIFARRERESIEHFKFTGEYDTFALEKSKYDEFKSSKYYSEENF